MSNMSYRATLDEALRCFGDPQKREEYFQLYSPDVVLHGYGGVEPGLENVKQFYRRFWHVFPDANIATLQIVEQGETAVVHHVTTGTLSETFMGVPPKGQRIKLPGISILHFREGRCFERWTCSDSLLLMRQLGAAPNPK